MNKLNIFSKNTKFEKEFFIFFFAPMMIIVLYFFLLAPDRYVSEANIQVKEAGVAKFNNNLLENLGFSESATSSDEQLLMAHIVSPNLLAMLDKEIALKEHFSQSNDFLFGLSMRSSHEDFIKFLRRHITLSLDSRNGLLLLHVEAYSPRYSKLLAEKLLQKSEDFINKSSQSIAKFEMDFAFNEISSSQARLKKAKQSLVNFQNQYGLVSPDSDGESLFAIIFSLENEVAKTEAEIHQAKSFLNKESPQVSALISKSNALKKEIAVQKLRLTGDEGGVNKLNELSAKYQSFLLDVDLATTLYTSSLSSYEFSRVQSSKKVKHIVIASKPYLAEEAIYPRKLYWIASWSVLFIIIWCIYRLIISSVKEHQD
ncbi:MAG: hypothetical protein P8M71_06080 [Pseudomonadales bacterium]|nr:hypothetical protein [Pseudomonadales bacterium]